MARHGERRPDDGDGDHYAVVDIPDMLTTPEALIFTRQELADCFCKIFDNRYVRVLTDREYEREQEEGPAVVIRAEQAGRGGAARMKRPSKKARRPVIHDEPASVAKNAWWMALCPTHGNQPHLGVLGGMCEQCKRDKEAKES